MNCCKSNTERQS